MGLTLYNANARIIDPILGGRFLSIDPLAREFPNISPYAYGNNNPLRFTDPTGMAPDDVFLNSETNEVTIIETDDEYDVLYVDGEVAGATDVNAWRDEASNIYDSYTDFFTENSWAITDDNWLDNFNKAERMEVKQGIFNARMAMGSEHALKYMLATGIKAATGISFILTYGSVFNNIDLNQVEKVAVTAVVLTVDATVNVGISSMENKK